MSTFLCCYNLCKNPLNNKLFVTHHVNFSCLGLFNLVVNQKNIQICLTINLNHAATKLGILMNTLLTHIGHKYIPFTPYFKSPSSSSLYSIYANYLCNFPTARYHSKMIKFDSSLYIDKCEFVSRQFLWYVMVFCVSVILHLNPISRECFTNRERMLQM